MKYPTEKRMLWLSQVRSVPYRQRVELAAKNCFGWLSTSPMDYKNTRAGGLSDKDIRSIAADNDVRLSYLDPLTSWVPDGLTPGEDPDIKPYLDTTPDDFFRIAEALQVDRIHLIGSFPEGRYTLDELTGHYAALCDRAAENGLNCLIEAMPLWGLKTVDEVWTIVRDAGRKNSGIIFDTWHYVRGGRNDALLKEIPVGTFDTVQIADGPLVCPPGRSMKRDCLSYRVPIGQGEIPNLEILKILKDAGHIESVGPEIFSDALDKLEGDEIMSRLMPGFEALLEELARHEPL
ncbi:sugar phosphate isomerase/epimerase family protein [Rhizobium ruizarguesonis]